MGRARERRKVACKAEPDAGPGAAAGAPARETASTGDRGGRLEMRAVRTADYGASYWMAVSTDVPMALNSVLSWLPR